MSRKDQQLQFKIRRQQQQSYFVICLLVFVFIIVSIMSLGIYVSYSGYDDKTLSHDIMKLKKPNNLPNDYFKNQ